ncbi:hypothetical protein EV174_000333 [Coemansia sp. RSA 2320]|nr:hypothetical protein EV174_000333 [Coemansia sp. RSA 2320]
MNSAEPNPSRGAPASDELTPGSRARPGNSHSSAAGGRRSGGQARRLESGVKGSQQGPDGPERAGQGGAAADRRRAGSGGSPSNRGKGKRSQQQPAQSAAAVVVPRILMRPERAAAAAADEAVVPAAASSPQFVWSGHPAQPPRVVALTAPLKQHATAAGEREQAGAVRVAVSPPQQPPQHPHSLALQLQSPPLSSPSPSLAITGIAAYRQIADLPRSSRLTLLSSSGKLLDTVARKNLGALQTRSCIGVLGRASAGKSLVLSELAHRACPAQPSIFPLAAESELGTLGVDFWVTPARVILLDAPPVLSLPAADKWPRRADPSTSRLSAARIRDLQLAALLLQVCDVLLVFANCGSAGDCVDRGLAKLLVDACAIAEALPGLALPCLAASGGNRQSGRCRLHIVLNAGAPRNGGAQNLAPLGGPLDIGAVARGYEEATGISVCNVSLIPSLPARRNAAPSLRDDSGGSGGGGGMVPRFLQIAETWSATAAQLPLYSPPRDVFKSSSKLAEKQRRRSLLSWPSLGGEQWGSSFERAIDAMRSSLLGPGIVDGAWREESEGTWVATCLRAWDSIRRSDHLQKLALVRNRDIDDMDTTPGGALPSQQMSHTRSTGES